ncbi:hypothetical protein [Spirochaeta cellobiosiphila]|uniref:hypothetical protein n=1 Tax=Spirochaeta cellobiosiphila TaxID=504483 RepID=UPI0004209145|nr:hypothetical protein [Spirochaeta cellobiosiphila]
MEDKRNILREDKPFSYNIIKDQKAQVFYKGKLVMTIKSEEVNKLLVLKNKADEYQIQLFLAKITGQFKHGNER